MTTKSNPPLQGRDYWTVYGPGPNRSTTPNYYFGRAIIAAAIHASPDDLQRIKETWPYIWHLWEQAGIEAAKLDAQIADGIASDKAYQLALKEQTKARLEAREQRRLERTR